MIFLRMFGNREILKILFFNDLNGTSECQYEIFAKTSLSQINSLLFDLVR